MPEEIIDNQRVAVIVAVILAALTAAGLWYFFVFRAADTGEFVVETPIVVGESPTHAPAVVGITDAPPGPIVQAPEAAPVNVPPTATTGPGMIVLLASATATMAGLLGLRARRQTAL